MDTIFELFSSKDESLLIRRDAFFFLDFGFDIIDRVGGFDLEGNGLTRQSLDENLHYLLASYHYRTKGWWRIDPKEGLTFDVGYDELLTVVMCRSLPNYDCDCVVAEKIFRVMIGLNF